MPTASTTDIFVLSDAAVDQVAADDPVLATYQGIAGFDHLWPDLSPEGSAVSRAMYARFVEDAKACEVPDDRHRLAQRVLLEHAEMMVRYYDANGPQYDFNNIASPHQTFRFIYGSMGDQSLAEWDAILTRLETMSNALSGYQLTLEEGRTAGNVVSRRQVESVIAQGASAAGDDSSFESLHKRLETSPAHSPELSERLNSAIDLAKQAVASFNTYLENTYLPSARTHDGVGEERYVQAAEMFLGTRLDPHATYRWGWNEVERLWGEMQSACAEIDPDVPASTVLERLNSAPEYAAADLDDFVVKMKERQDQALANLEGVHFDVPEPIRTIDVQVEPAGGALAAHYVGPSEDFSRAGSVWYPVDGATHFPLFAEVTTAYHEGFPGHHLQVGVQVGLKDELSRFHRSVVWYPGSGEGWALYAEHLMGELGYLERPEYVVGLISSQLLRASRVAIDIGVHLDLEIPEDVSFHPGEKWSFELAHELLRTRAFVREEEATSEVTRYFGWPGQAISYKVGEQAILDLRADWQAGDNYDPKVFHSTVLGVGSVGLDLLEDHVRAAQPAN